MTLMRSRLVSFLAACSLAVPLFAINDPVRIDSGLVSGIAGNNAAVRVYKGIPYASPPVGDLRWKAPKRATSWDGVRKADRFSAVCEQQPYPVTSIYASAP